jgi:outer membrane receptor protein involved in Fe transport
MADVNYSYYIANNNVSSYAIPGNTKELLGMPSQKLTGRITYKLHNYSFTASAVYLGQTYGVDQILTTGSTTTLWYKKYDATILANAFINYDNLLLNGFSIGVGCNNFLNQKYAFIQPYNSGHAPLPALDRMLFVKISYKI